MINTIWHKIIDNRRDEIGATISEDSEYMKQFNAVIEAQETLRAKLSPENRDMIDQLEEAQAALVGLVESKYYLAGLRDGTSLKQFLTGEGAIDVAS